MEIRPGPGDQSVTVPRASGTDDSLLSPYRGTMNGEPLSSEWPGSPRHQGFLR
jgi:hypothetical protein